MSATWNRTRPSHGLAACLALAVLVLPVAAADKAEPPLKPVPHAQFRFGGVIGQRISANVDQWLLRVPDANPGMIESLRLRDRKPERELPPEASAYAGLYLLSAIPMLQLDARLELRQAVSNVVAELIANQADDGYLGPFSKSTRLKNGLDAWGHYQSLLALLLWHEVTGDPAALAACRRAADLARRTLLDSRSAGQLVDEINLRAAIIHALGRLHCRTSDSNVLQAMQSIESIWESAGDYLRTGLAGLDFFKTPGPRWESLANLQGLAELGRSTGDERHRIAFLNHWRSIRHWDRRLTGGFGEAGQATGNAFAATSIETPGTVAWMALTLDALALTGESTFADELELSTLNAAAGAQHPSGAWWAHSAPMEGVREPLPAGQNFARIPGAPELTLSSLSGPRALAMLAEWAVMNTPDGLAVNSYLPGAFQGKLQDQSPVALKWETDYPLSNKVNLRVEPLVPRRFNLKLRIPEWSRVTTVRLNSAPVPNVAAGRYLELNRRWEVGDRVALEFDFTLRELAGQREAAGKAAIFRGPLLLTWDQRDHAFDEDAVPLMDAKQLGAAKEVFLRPRSDTSTLSPWVLIEIGAPNGTLMRLRDFASAGSAGTRYRSWLPWASASPEP